MILQPPSMPETGTDANSDEPAPPELDDPNQLWLPLEWPSDESEQPLIIFKPETE